MAFDALNRNHFSHFFIASNVMGSIENSIDGRCILVWLLMDACSSILYLFDVLNRWKHYYWMLVAIVGRITNKKSSALRRMDQLYSLWVVRRATWSLRMISILLAIFKHEKTGSSFRYRILCSISFQWGRYRFFNQRNTKLLEFALKSIRSFSTKTSKSNFLGRR